MTPKNLPADANPRVPAPGTFHHYIPVQIRFTDIDALGHVNNAVYINYFDLGKTKYFESAMHDAIDWGNIGVVIVNINCSYYAPTLYEESIEVLTKVTEIGQRSLHVEQRLINSDTMQTKAVCYTILSGFSRETMKSVEITPEWITALEKYEEAKLTR
ncbi:MAG: acyl-CoA thioesterase [Duncaniella sp.]|nr:acyl-CoA thioesterase [Duncaniella sp.]